MDGRLSLRDNSISYLDETKKITHRAIFATENNDPVLYLPFGRIKPIQESDNILRFLSVNPILLFMVG
jgi:hypothetical protein